MSGELERSTYASRGWLWAAFVAVLALVENARGMLNEVAGRLRALVDRLVEAAGQADSEAGRELQSGGAR